MGKPIQIHEQENKLLEFTVTDENNNTEDLTQANEVYLEIWTERQPYGEKQFVEKGENVTSTGKVEFDIESSDTKDIRNGNYVYEVWVDYPDEEFVAEVGNFFVKPRTAK